MRGLVRIARRISLLGLAALSAFAQFTPISTPDAAYTSSTTLIPITAANGTTGITSVTAGSQTITLSTGLQAAQVPGGGWATWNSPPNAETATPKVLVRSSALASLTLTLSSPTTTFGFELEPNVGAFPFSVAFMNGATTLGTVTLSPNGVSGSLLFAASSSTPITGAVITETNNGSNGYAIAQLRHHGAAQAVPALSAWGTIVLTGLLLLYGCTQLRRRGEMRGRA